MKLLQQINERFYSYFDNNTKMFFTLTFGDRGVCGNGKAWYLSVAYNGDSKQTIATFTTRDDGYGCYKDDYRGMLWNQQAVILAAEEMVAKMVPAQPEKETKSSLEICKMLTLSTAHIKETTAEAIEKRYDSHLCNWPDELSIYNKEEFGWWIHLPDDSVENLCNVPGDLAACLNLAEENGCEWLCLDCDGLIATCLPTYEWE